MYGLETENMRLRMLVWQQLVSWSITITDCVYEDVLWGQRTSLPALRHPPGRNLMKESSDVWWHEKELVTLQNETSTHHHHPRSPRIPIWERECVDTECMGIQTPVCFIQTFQQIHSPSCRKNKNQCCHKPEARRIWLSNSRKSDTDGSWVWRSPKVRRPTQSIAATLLARKAHWSINWLYLEYMNPSEL